MLFCSLSELWHSVHGSLNIEIPGLPVLCSENLLEKNVLK